MLLVSEILDHNGWCHELFVLIISEPCRFFVIRVLVFLPSLIISRIYLLNIVNSFREAVNFMLSSGERWLSYICMQLN